MRLLPRRKGRGSSVSLTKPESIACRQQARAADRDATRRLAETQARWPEVRAMASNLANIRSKNHFSEAIVSAVMRGQK